jgi:hypothetical protein
MKIVLSPKHVVTVTTEDEKEDCCVEGIINYLIIHGTARIRGHAVA